MSDNALIVAPVNAAMPIMGLQDAKYRRQALIDFTRSLMVEGQHFGKVPGTDKPTLLKPGAEMLIGFFGLEPSSEVVEAVTDWTGETHGGEPFFHYAYRVTLRRDGRIVGSGDGSCNSWEKKYRYRTVYANRATAEDKEHGRLETRQGRGGSSYQVYVVKNPDPADLENTIRKMAHKRALVAATLIAVNASEFFTQDMEDIIDGSWETAPEAPAQAPKPQAVPKQPPAPEPPVENAAPNGDGLQYGDGEFVPRDDRTRAAYNAYVEAHDGKAPDNRHNLRAWHLKQQAAANAATIQEGREIGMAAKAEAQAAQPALVDTNGSGGAYAE